MHALRLIKTVENDNVLIENLEAFRGKKIELIILPLLDEDEQLQKEMSGKGLSLAYGQNEPDYNILEVKERNPGYIV